MTKQYLYISVLFISLLAGCNSDGSALAQENNYTSTADLEFESSIMRQGGSANNKILESSSQKIAVSDEIILAVSDVQSLSEKNKLVIFLVKILLQLLKESQQKWLSFNLWTRD